MKSCSPCLLVASMSEHPTLRFAGEELVHYLGRMAGDSGAAVLVTKSVADSHSEERHLTVGLFSDFGLDPFPELDPFWDDAIIIRVAESRGIIAGLNPRSALHAVYRFLESGGCRWLRPGENGEWVPEHPVSNLECRLQEKPSFRYRGHSHCGGERHAVLEKIGWMAKVGSNVCFEEFFPPNCRSGYYLRRYPSLLPEEKRPMEWHQAAFQEQLAALKKRGILFQSVGHGWTGAVYGLYRVESPDDRAEFCRRALEKPEYLAEVNGERRPHRRGGALYTELCYGNPEVRQKLINAVVSYAQAHPEVDILQFSMSDAMNLMCECPLCRDVAPSDFLIILLNAIDAGLTARGLSTRIGFFLYQEIWWPPVREALCNPSRFLMAFCPIARNYQEPYSLDVLQTELPPFVYNRNERLQDREVLASLRQWRESTACGAIAFEYHLTWYHYFDPGQFALARLMQEDIRLLPQLGLEGVVGCQVVRAAFPTGFLLDVHARSLWNAGLNLETLAQSYFRAAFGEEGERCAAWLRELSAHFRPGVFYHYVPPREMPRDEEAIRSLAKVPGIVEAFTPVVERNLHESTHPVHKASWYLIFLYTQLVPRLAHCMQARLEGNQEAADTWWDQVLDFILINENRLSGVFDCQWFYEAHLRRANLFSPGFASTGGFERRDVLNVSAQLQDPRD